MNYRSSKDLHCYGIGIGSVEPLQVQHHLQVEEEALDRPPQWVEVDNVLGGQALRVEHIGESLVDSLTLRQPDEAQLTPGLPRASLYEPVFQEATFCSLSLEPAHLANRKGLVSPENSKGSGLLQKIEDFHRGAVQPIAQKQAAFVQALYGQGRTLELRSGGVSVEPDLPRDPAEKVVDRQDAPRKNSSFLSPQDLQTVSHFVEPGAVDHQDVGELLLQGSDCASVALRGQRKNLLDKAPMNLCHEDRREALALHEERLCARRHLGKEPLLLAPTHRVQEVAERRRRFQDGGEPKPTQSIEGPLALALGRPHIRVDLGAEGFGDVLVENLHCRHQVNVYVSIACRTLLPLSLPLYLKCTISNLGNHV